MKNCFLAVMLCIAIGACGGLRAGELQQGDRELAVEFSFNDSDFGSASGIDYGSAKSTELGVRWGWLFTDSQEFGFLAGYARDNVNGGNLQQDRTTDGTVIGGFYHYNINTGDTVTPYVGVTAFIIGGDLSDLYDTGYGVSVGVKLYPFENAGIVASMGYETLRGDSSLLPDGDAIDMSLGLSLKF